MNFYRFNIYVFITITGYVYIMLKEINIISSNSNSSKKNYMLKYENSTLKIYISELSNSILMSIQLLTSYFLSTK